MARLEGRNIDAAALVDEDVIFNAPHLKARGRKSLMAAWTQGSYRGFTAGNVEPIPLNQFRPVTPDSLDTFERTIQLKMRLMSVNLRQTFVVGDNGLITHMTVRPSLFGSKKAQNYGK